jgi:hypothetical protein
MGNVIEWEYQTASQWNTYLLVEVLTIVEVEVNVCRNVRVVDVG